MDSEQRQVFIKAIKEGKLTFCKALYTSWKSLYELLQQEDTTIHFSLDLHELFEYVKHQEMFDWLVSLRDFTEDIWYRSVRNVYSENFDYLFRIISYGLVSKGYKFPNKHIVVSILETFLEKDISKVKPFYTLLKQYDPDNYNYIDPATLIDKESFSSRSISLLLLSIFPESKLTLKVLDLVDSFSAVKFEYATCIPLRNCMKTTLDNLTSDVRYSLELLESRRFHLSYILKELLPIDSNVIEHILMAYVDINADTNRFLEQDTSNDSFLSRVVEKNKDREESDSEYDEEIYYESDSD